jgi:hypothetical protein
MNFITSDNNLIEECEAYFYHRHGFGQGNSSGNVFRRCYLNGRSRADGSPIPPFRGSGFAGTADSGGVLYWGADVTYENCIFEDCGHGVSGEADLSPVFGARRNKLLGCIFLDCWVGFQTTARGNIYARMSHDNEVEHCLFLNTKGSGVANRACEGVIVNHCSNYNTVNLGTLYYGWSADLNSPPNDGISPRSFTVKNSSAYHSLTNGFGTAGMRAFGYSETGGGHTVNVAGQDYVCVQPHTSVASNHPTTGVDGDQYWTPQDNQSTVGGTWVVDTVYAKVSDWHRWHHNNVYNAPFKALPDDGWDMTTVDPNYGDIRLWCPNGDNGTNVSPLVGQADDGGDIGCEILYAYENGILTLTKLWDDSTGAFLFTGATVSGINDSDGLVDVHERITPVGGRGVFPSSYSMSMTEIASSEMFSIDPSEQYQLIGPPNETILKLNIGRSEIYKRGRLQKIYWFHNLSMDLSATPIPVVTIEVSADDFSTIESTYTNVTNIEGWNSLELWFNTLSLNYRVRISDPDRAEVLSIGPAVFEVTDEAEVMGSI